MRPVLRPPETAIRERPWAPIRHLLGSRVGALRARDLDAVRAIQAPDVVPFAVAPPLRHVGIEAQLANRVKAFDTFATIDDGLRDLTLTVDERVAFGHAFGRLRGALADGTAVPVDVRTGTAATHLEP